MDLPGIDYCAIAWGYGVRAIRNASRDELAAALVRSVASDSPSFSHTNALTRVRQSSSHFLASTLIVHESWSTRKLGARGLRKWQGGGRYQANEAF